MRPTPAQLQAINEVARDLNRFLRDRYPDLSHDPDACFTVVNALMQLACTYVALTADNPTAALEQAAQRIIDNTPAMLHWRTSFEDREYDFTGGERGRYYADARRARTERRDAREFEAAIRFELHCRLIALLRYAWSAKADAFYAWEEMNDDAL